MGVLVQKFCLLATYTNPRVPSERSSHGHDGRPYNIKIKNITLKGSLEKCIQKPGKIK